MGPLLRENKPIGVLVAVRYRMEPFTEKQLALFGTFADQAVIAIENARLLSELRESLEQQQAIAEVLQVINSSPGELAPVFDAILEKAMQQCEAAFGLLLVPDGELQLAIAHRALSPALAEYFDRPIHGGVGLVGRLQAGEAAVQIADAADDEIYRAGAPSRRAIVDLGGARTAMAVALRKDGTYLGAFWLYRQQVRPFSDKQIGLLQNFAAQAVIAMENARLLTETREALEQQTATADVLQVINASPDDLTPVFDAILEKTLALCTASFGDLSTYDGEQFDAVAARGFPPALIDFYRNPFTPGPKSYFGQLVNGKDVLHIADMAAEFSSAPASPLSGAGVERGRALVELGNARTGLFLALRKDGALLGAMRIFRQEVQPFTDKQIALVENFAAQAVIAMENARLITETREALEQQTATSEVLGVINTSPGDLAPVFDAMLEKATRLCEATCGQLATYDGEFFHFVAVHDSQEYADFLSKNPSIGPPGSDIGRLIAGEDVVHRTDFGPEALPPTAHAKAFAELAGAKTSLMVALRKDSLLLGAVTVYRREARPFTDKQIALLQNFAAQAVIAMENARLLTETREALEQQTATAEVLGVINSSPGDLKPVFEAMLEKAMTMCGAAFGALMSYDGEKVVAVATRGLPPELDEIYREPWQPARSHESPYARFFRGDPLLHIIDMAAEDALPPLGSRPRSLVDIGGARTGLEIPLRKEGALLGSIWFYRREVRPFSDKQIALLQNFAAQAVIAIENARLLGELRERTDEVAELNRGLEARVAEQVEELGRVGRLKRFLAPQLAELIVSQGDEKILESHRQGIVVVFCDLRGYTAFTETAEPEEVLAFLREYHGALGPLVTEFEGTLDQFSGDGIMVFFNDPVPCPDPAERAVKMATAMREAAGGLIASWRRRRGRVLGFGAGIAQGYATLGQIGFAERSGYTAIGTVCNLAARLCAEAKDGQILLAQPVAVAVEETIPVEEVGELALRGLTQPVLAYNVPLAAGHPALRVIEGGPANI